MGTSISELRSPMEHLGLPFALKPPLKKKEEVVESV